MATQKRASPNFPTITSQNAASARKSLTSIYVSAIPHVGDDNTNKQRNLVPREQLSYYLFRWAHGVYRAFSNSTVPIAAVIRAYLLYQFDIPQLLRVLAGINAPLSPPMNLSNCIYLR